jgi:single-stranded-DNA-specific exonuclease
MVNIVKRTYSQADTEQLIAQGYTPLLAKVLAARGITNASQLEASLLGLIPPQRLTNAPQMAILLADAIAQNKFLLVIGDYDADGATASAIAIRGLRSMGARVDYLVPNRFEYGYGLTPEIVQLAHKQKPNLIITVDNGIASIEGVALANKLGMQVLVTDHHLPADETPQAACIVNPNQLGCDFPSKNLAGVGVMFYVLMSLRYELRNRGMFETLPEPNLTELLDLVALGTVADLVKLDDNNRILVEQGLRRIRAGKSCPAIRALMQLAGRDHTRIHAHDLGFSVGPRLNAAGRLDDMSLGIACLISDDEDAALAMAQKLQSLNIERREIEADMQQVAQIALEEVDVEDRYSLSVYDESWHQGVIGILASRLKERYHRPVIAFADAGNGLLKGSGRSIQGLHLRDALDLLTKHQPDLILKFGGHAMAAGLTIQASEVDRFHQAFEAVVRSLLTPDDLQLTVQTDGELNVTEMTWETAHLLERQVWGQGFPAPLFYDTFQVKTQRIVGEKHLKLSLLKADAKQAQPIDAIFFQHQELLPDTVHLVYQLQTNEYNGVKKAQLNVQQWLAT